MAKGASQTAGVGHNSGAVPGSTGGVAADKLKSFVERIERLEAEKTELAADIREVYSEAKGNGFDTKIMRQVVKRRRMEAADRREQDELLALYEGIFA